MNAAAAAKNFLKTCGTVGIGVYGAVTVLNMTAIYVSLRLGVGDAVLLQPLEAVLGSNSETFAKIKQQLGQVKNNNQDKNMSSDGGGVHDKMTINWVREGTYFGIATAVDSLVSPVKLVICLPLARAILKRRGR